MPLVLVLLAAALVATAALGPLGLGLLIWRVSPSGLVQLYGAHAAELLLVAPAALAAALLWRRRHRLAPALALGAAGYALYVSVQFVLFPDYSLHPGNSERFFPLFLATAFLAWIATAHSWAALDAAPPAPPRWLSRAFSIVVLASNAMIGFLWTSQVLAIAFGGPPPADYASAPTGFWLIRLIDLGLIIPISVAAAIGLWRGSPLAARAAPGVASFLTLELSAVLAMGLAQLWLDDPTASPALVASLTPLFLALAVTSALLLRALARPPHVADRRAPHPETDAPVLSVFPSPSSPSVRELPVATS